MKLLQIFKRNLCIDYIMIDDSDFEKCKNFKWHIKKNRIITNTGMLLHHLLFPLKNHDLKYTMTFLDGNPSLAVQSWVLRDKAFGIAMQILQNV
jgi:hypothetical protein